MLVNYWSLIAYIATTVIFTRTLPMSNAPKENDFYMHRVKKNLSFQALTLL